MQKQINNSKKQNINDMFVVFQPTNSLNLTLTDSFKNLDFTLDPIAQNKSLFSETIQSALSNNKPLKVVELVDSFQKELDFYSKNIQKTIDFIQKNNMKSRHFLIQNKLEQLEIISQNKNFLSQFVQSI